jgi:hypothetical protein
VVFQVPKRDEVKRNQFVKENERAAKQQQIRKQLDQPVAQHDFPLPIRAVENTQPENRQRVGRSLALWLADVTGTAARRDDGDPGLTTEFQRKQISCGPVTLDIQAP